MFAMLYCPGGSLGLQGCVLCRARTAPGAAGCPICPKRFRLEHIQDAGLHAREDLQLPWLPGRSSCCYLQQGLLGAASLKASMLAG